MALSALPIVVKEEKGERRCQLTSFRGTRGGPAAMLADLVPRWMRRFAFASIAVCSICCAWRLVFVFIDGA